jgi:predicted amidohydrolase
MNIRSNHIPIGLTVCYDLRFPELYQILSKNPSTMMTTLHYDESHGTVDNVINEEVAMEKTTHHYEKFEASMIGGAKILLIPAAFTVKTGLVHWEVLLRARAIENQCFVVAAAQNGTHQRTGCCDDNLLLSLVQVNTTRSESRTVIR